jgi:hypothetical protein
MMGGDLDNASKGIAGICTVISKNKEIDAHFLTLDPHYCSNQLTSKQYLIENNWISWQSCGPLTDKDSFYNFCLPQFKYNKQNE